MITIKDIINRDEEIRGGQPVFTGTRVPIESLFMHLEEGVSLDEFLEDFPTVSLEQSISLLELTKKIITSKPLKKFIKLFPD